MDDEASRGLRGMSGHVRTQCGDPKVRAVVYKSAVLQSKGNMAHESVFHASPVNKCRAGLLLCPGNESSRVPPRIKPQPPPPPNPLTPHPPNLPVKPPHQP